MEPGWQKTSDLKSILRSPSAHRLKVEERACPSFSFFFLLFLYLHSLRSFFRKKKWNCGREFKILQKTFFSPLWLKDGGSISVVLYFLFILKHCKIPSTQIRAWQKFSRMDNMVSWTLIPFFKFCENKLVPMKAKSDPNAIFCSLDGYVERRYLHLSAILVQTTAVQASLTLKAQEKVMCIPKNKTVSHVARSPKNKRKLCRGILFLYCQSWSH